MYFQICSNSAYPQLSDELYRIMVLYKSNVCQISFITRCIIWSIDPDLFFCFNIYIPIDKKCNKIRSVMVSLWIHRITLTEFAEQFQIFNNKMT